MFNSIELKKKIRQENDLYSVFDIIQNCGKKNPRATWSSLIKAYPDVLGKTDNVKFRDSLGRRGSKLTPAATKEVCLEIIELLPNIAGNKKTKTQDKFYPRTEQSIISVLVAAFADQNPQKQYPVSKYRVDLYLSVSNIVIECDENGHTNYDKKIERKRNQTIKTTLGCSIVRFNPYSNDFNIGELIYKLRQYISEQQNDSEKNFSPNSLYDCMPLEYQMMFDFSQLLSTKYIEKNNVTDWDIPQITQSMAKKTKQFYLDALNS